MSNFLVFGGNDDEPVGGALDFQKAYSTLGAAKSAGAKLEWAQIATVSGNQLTLLFEWDGAEWQNLEDAEDDAEDDSDDYDWADS